MERSRMWGRSFYSMAGMTKLIDQVIISDSQHLGALFQQTGGEEKVLLSAFLLGTSELNSSRIISFNPLNKFMK